MIFGMTQQVFIDVIIIAGIEAMGWAAVIVYLWERRKQKQEEK